MYRVGRIAYYVLLLCMIATPAFCQWDELNNYLHTDSYDIGGEFRTRGEMRNDYYTPAGLSSNDDKFVLLRSVLFADIHPYDEWNIFLEVQDSRKFDSSTAARNVVPNRSESDIDLFQGYLHLNQIAGSPFSLRIGRQELNYGDKRVLSAPNWSNVRRSFDAVRLITEWNGIGTLDILAAMPVQHDWDNFNTSNDDHQIYGGYFVGNGLEWLDIYELYYLVRNRDSRNDETHTIGTRLGNKYESGWDWEMEVIGQFGDYGGLDHTAFAVHGEVGYRFDVVMKPRAELGYSHASGDDDPTDGEHNTFDNLFPTNHKHYGIIDFFSFQNMHGLEANVQCKPIDELSVTAGYHAFWLDEPETDNWYRSNRTVLRNGAPGADSYVGSELDLRAVYTVNKHVKVDSGYAVFLPGDFVDDTGDDDVAHFGYMALSLAF